MKKPSKIIILSVVPSLLMIFSDILVAEGPPSATQITASAGSVGMFEDVPVNDDVLTVLQSYLHAGRSYECALLLTAFSDVPESVTDDFRIFSPTVTGPDSAIVSVTANGHIFPQMTGIKPLVVSATINTEQQSRLRYSIIPNQSGLHKFTTVDALDNGGSDNYAYKCRETTIFGSYNRFYAQTAIVEIQNKSETSIPVQITIVDGGGNVIINKQGAIANANTRTDIIFGNLPANSYGQIIITHTAPFGALQGVVAEYDQSANGTITLKRERPLQTAQRS